MPFVSRGLLCCLVGSGSLLAAEDSAAAAWRRFSAQSARVLLEAQRAPLASEALPEGVAELSFREFFSPVVGDRGPEYTARMRALHGRRVRIAGFMTRDFVRHPGVFLLTGWPTKVESDGYCFNDELPPATLHVVLPPAAAGEPAPYVPGPMLLTGTLLVGPSAMPDGRNAVARLVLDAPRAGATGLLTSSPATANGATSNP
jgi:hypothetical protein